jgi:hypothetical protein
MPVHVHEADGIVELRMVGAYETSDVRGVLLGALAQPPEVPRRGMLFDVTRSAVLTTRTANELRQMAMFLSGEAPRYGGRLALLADGPAPYGLMRLGGTHTELAGVDTAVFRDEREARAWLDRKADPMPARA